MGYLRNRISLEPTDCGSGYRLLGSGEGQPTHNQEEIIATPQMYESITGASKGAHYFS